ncbi:unnamed protein product, partial [marine sediment metagenome]
MCLAIPARIIKINKNVAEIESLGVKKEVDISLTPEAKVGNFVIVHAGFAIMLKDIESIKKYYYLSKKEIESLTSARAPIVLLKKKAKNYTVSWYVSLYNRYEGVMLP